MRYALVLGVIAVTLVIAGAPSGAQTYKYHPDSNPTSGGGNTFPFGNAFGPDWRYQLFVPQSSLGSTPVRITNFAFAPSSSNTFSATQFQIRMAHTTLAALTSTFGTNIGSCPTELHNGAFTYTVTSGNWHDLGTQSDFGYDGTRNVVLEIRYRNRTAPSTSQFVFRTGTSRLHANNITTPPTRDPYNAVAGQLDPTRGLKVRFTCVATCVAIAQSDRVRVGSTIGTQLINGPGGAFYQFACSFGQGPPLNLGNNCRLGLATDALFTFSLQGSPIFQGFSGQLPATGRTLATTIVPNIPQLAGLCIYHAAVTYSRTQLLCCSNTAGVELIP
jgi:hypothetical protein